MGFMCFLSQQQQHHESLVNRLTYGCKPVKSVIDHTCVNLVVINDDEDLSAAIGALTNNIKSFDPKDLLIAHVQVSHAPRVYECLNKVPKNL